MKTAPLFLAAVLAGAWPARANDGFGGLGASGLEFSQTDKVAMVSEDLFISLKKIKVSYVFENTADEDVTGEVIFPLPPVALLPLFESDTNLPEDVDRENLVNFTVEVDGQSITPAVERRAVRFSYVPGSEGEEVLGDDVTILLKEAGIPMSLKPQRIIATLDKLSPPALEKLVSAGLLEKFDGDPRYLCKWAIAIRYHWEQTFAAGTKVSIKHTYENYPPGGIWSWSHPATEDYQREITARYCIDESTSKALARCHNAYEISYILRTANTWKGPIGNFKLTIDKGNPRNILSLCATDVEKTGPTTFVIEKKNYTPPEDLQILVATPGLE